MSRPERRVAVAQRTFIDYGTERLAALCHALDAGLESVALVETFQRLLHPWGERLIGQSPRCRSNVADDGAPFEFSIALSRGAPEVQVYVDPHADPPTPAANLCTARALLDMVAHELDAPLDRLREVENLFLPPDPGPPFGLWIGASWTPGHAVRLKVYLNPHVLGHRRAPELVGDAMRRLGFARAWSELEGTLSLRDGRDEVGIICLDLTGTGGERIKLYVRHHGASVDRIERVARMTGEHGPRDVERFYSTLAGHRGPFEQKPAATVVAFVDPGSDRPAAVGLEFPIGSYVDTDEHARERVVRCLDAFGLAPEPYERALRAFATRPLETHGGIHAHVTLRQLAGGPRVAVYFASEAYPRGTPGARA